jgi:hypothetical protein
MTSQGPFLTSVRAARVDDQVLIDHQNELADCLIDKHQGRFGRLLFCGSHYLDRQGLDQGDNLTFGSQ